MKLLIGTILAVALGAAPALAADACYMNSKAGGSVLRLADAAAATFTLNGHLCRVSFETRAATAPGFGSKIETGTCYDGEKPVMAGQFVGVSDGVIVFDGAVFRDFGACPSR